MIRNTHLYVIYDRVSKVPETKVIECLNDAVAIQGFKGFLKDDNISPEEHKLVHVAMLDEDKNFINTDKYLVCTGDKADEVFEEIKVKLLNEEEEEE